MIKRLITNLKSKLPASNRDTSLGLLLASIGSFLSAMGFVLMKLAHNKRGKRLDLRRKPIFCNLIWLAGWLCIMGGITFNIFALNTGNQFIVTSTSGLSMIFNTLLSVFFLKERFYHSDVCALSLIVLGSYLFMAAVK